MTSRTIVSLLALACSLPAFAGNEKGNGDLSHVCRSHAGAILRDDVLDLYRGAVEGHLTIPQSRLPIEQQVGRAVDLLSDYVDLYNFVLDFLPPGFTVQKTGISGLLQFGPTGVPLTDTDDDVPPASVDGCPYEQLAVYTQGGALVVQPELFDHLSLTGKSAFYLHETLYYLAREYSDAVDSLLVQRLVARLFESKPDPAVIRDLVGAVFPRVPVYDHCQRRALPAVLSPQGDVSIRITPLAPSMALPNDTNQLYVELSLTPDGKHPIKVGNVSVRLADSAEFALPIAPQGLRGGLVFIDGAVINPSNGTWDIPVFSMEIRQNGKVLSAWDNQGNCWAVPGNRWWIPLR
jgi:hypothetical protein